MAAAIVAYYAGRDANAKDESDRDHGGLGEPSLPLWAGLAVGVGLLALVALFAICSKKLTDDRIDDCQGYYNVYEDICYEEPFDPR